MAQASRRAVLPRPSHPNSGPSSTSIWSISTRRRAAIRAGYSPDTAGSIGHENLKKPEIAAAIAERKAKRSEDAADRASRAARRLEDIALMDLGDSMKDVPPPLLNVVQGAEVNLLKLDGKFSEKHEHKAMVTVVIEGDDAGLL